MARSPAATIRDLAGRTFGRYQVLTQLAAGGMASVHIARTRGLAGFERLVALKLLHPHLAYEEEFITMFLDEARLAALIRHPNVVPTLDISDSGGDGYFIVMEYIEGDHLGALLAAASKRGEGLPLPVVSRITLDALGGLSAAHELRDEIGEALNLVHRDISPHNVLVGVDGVSRLTDFGVAKAEKRLSTTRAGQLKGKLSYMAPEQASTGETDQRSDLFSTGILVWEALTTRRLFKAETNGAILNRVLHGEIPPPSSYGEDLRPFDAVLAKALDRDPDSRFQTALEFAEALEEAARQSGGIAPQREVGAHVRRLVGDKLGDHRRRVRTAFDRFGRSEVSHDAIPLPTDSSVELEDVEVEEAPRERGDSIPNMPATLPGKRRARTSSASQLKLVSSDPSSDDEATVIALSTEDALPEDSDETVLGGALDPARFGDDSSAATRIKLEDEDDEPSAVQRSGRSPHDVAGRPAFNTMPTGELPLESSPPPRLASEPPSGESSRSRMPIYAAALVLLGAGAGFLFMTFSRGPSAADAPTTLEQRDPLVAAPPAEPVSSSAVDPEPSDEPLAIEGASGAALGAGDGAEDADPAEGGARAENAEGTDASAVVDESHGTDRGERPRDRPRNMRAASEPTSAEPTSAEPTSTEATRHDPATEMEAAATSAGSTMSPSTMSPSTMSGMRASTRQGLLDDDDGLGTNPYRRGR